MTYELCKKLKDAGFPFSDLLKQAIYRDKGEANFYYEPTLSELIKACGDRFRSLSFAKLGNEQFWEATGGFDNLRSITNGGTPEEVVVLLWLELNKLKKREAMTKLQEALEQEIENQWNQLKPEIKAKTVFSIGDTCFANKDALGTHNNYSRPSLITFYLDPIENQVKEKIVKFIRKLITHELIHSIQAVKNEKEAYEKQDKLNFL